MTRRASAILAALDRRIAAVQRRHAIGAAPGYGVGRLYQLKGLREARAIVAKALNVIDTRKGRFR